MPTAVERLLDSFLKIEGIRDPGLNQAFTNIDGDLVKLTNATGDNFHQFEHKHKIENDLNEIGDAFLKLGVGFHKVETAGRLIDNFIGLTSAGGGGGAGIQADLESADHKVGTSAADLHTLGLDFLKLDSSPNLTVFNLKLDGIGNDFLKLSSDMAGDAAAFLKLGADFQKLGGGDTKASSPLDMAYKELGGDLRTLGGQFETLAGDFLKLDAAWSGGGGAGRGDPNAAGGGGGAGGPIGAAFMTLMQDFHVLGTDLGAVAQGAAKVIEELGPNGFLTHSHGGGGGAG